MNSSKKQKKHMALACGLMLGIPIVVFAANNSEAIEGSQSIDWSAPVLTKYQIFVGDGNQFLGSDGGQLSVGYGNISNYTSNTAMIGSYLLNDPENGGIGNSNSLIVGRFNEFVPNSAFVVGTGQRVGSVTTRENALVVKDDGTVEMNILKVGGKSVLTSSPEENLNLNTNVFIGDGMATQLAPGVARALLIGDDNSSEYNSNVGAVGIGLKADTDNSFYSGKYNQQNGALFSVGNGTSDTSRSNAFEVHNDGAIKGQDFVATGNFYTNGISQSPDPISNQNTYSFYTHNNIIAGSSNHVGFGQNCLIVGELNEIGNGIKFNTTLLGSGLKTDRGNCVAVGSYNEDVNAVFTVANGSSAARSNAFEVHADGSIVINERQGDISMGIFGGQ